MKTYKPLAEQPESRSRSLPHLPQARSPRGSVGRASFLTSQTDYRWWFDSPLVREQASSGDPPKGKGRRPKKKTISQRPDAGKVEADRDAVSAGLAFQLQPTAALACNKGLTPICGPTKEANEPPSCVLSLGDQLRQVYEQSPLPATGSLCSCSYAAESGLP